MCGHIGTLPLWKDTTENITFPDYVASGKKGNGSYERELATTSSLNRQIPTEAQMDLWTVKAHSHWAEVNAKATSLPDRFQGTSIYYL